MSAKGEIGWKRRDEFGERVQVKAKKVGDQWRFHIRARRFDEWQPHPEPPLEDWLELLDCVKRRVQRHRIPEEELPRLKRMMRELFPTETI